MSPLKAYNLGLMTEAHHLFKPCSLLSSLYSSLKDIYKAIDEAYNKRDDEGFYDIDHDLIEEFLIEKEELLLKISQLECSLLFDS